MRGKSIEPASLTGVAREVNLRREVTVNNNLSSCLGIQKLLGLLRRGRVVCEMDLKRDK